MLKTKVFFGKSQVAGREYEEWFNAIKFESVDVEVALRPYLDGGSEVMIVVVYGVYEEM